MTLDHPFPTLHTRQPTVERSISLATQVQRAVNHKIIPKENTTLVQEAVRSHQLSTSMMALPITATLSFDWSNQDDSAASLVCGFCSVPAIM